MATQLSVALALSKCVRSALRMALSAVTRDGDARPESYYDNYGGEVDVYTAYADDKYDQLRNEMLGYEKAKNPTQTISLLTTVPQNITPQNIAGGHAPTRQSLRHSRMIVMNRLSSTVPNGKQIAPMQRFHRLARVLIILQLLLGIAICAIAFCIFIFAPSITQRNNPYWSGIPLTISGLVGLLFLCCPHTHRRSMNNLVSSMKVLSTFLGFVAGAVCLVASTFAFLHLFALMLMTCEPALQSANSCMCTFTNATTTHLPAFVTQHTSYHYVDLQCTELNNFFVFFMIASCGCNLIAALIAFWYVFVHWSARYLCAYQKVHQPPQYESA